jgi:hypothetical protein
MTLRVMRMKQVEERLLNGGEESVEATEGGGVESGTVEAEEPQGAVGKTLGVAEEASEAEASGGEMAVVGAGIEGGTSTITMEKGTRMKGIVVSRGAMETSDLRLGGKMAGREARAISKLAVDSCSKLVETRSRRQSTRLMRSRNVPSVR